MRFKDRTKVLFFFFSYNNLRGKKVNTQKYKESLSKTPEPVVLNDIKQKMDLRGLMQYAKEKGIKIEEMSDEEKTVFIKNEDAD